MKILYVQETDWILRGPHQQHHLLERMSQRGHEIRVIDYNLLWRGKGNQDKISKRFVTEPPAKTIKNSKIKLIRPFSIYIPLFDKLLIPFIYPKEIKYQIKSFHPNVIIGAGILNVHIAQKIAKKNRIPFIFYSIDKNYSLVSSFIQKGFAKFYEKMNIKNAIAVIAINKGLRNLAIKMGCKAENVKIISGGVDVKKYEFTGNRKMARKKYGIKEKDIVLIFMGWLYDFSGIKEVVLEFAKNKDKYLNIKILIVGEGDLYIELQKIREKYDLHDHIILTGRQSFDKMPEFLAISDISLLPAYKNDIMQDIVPIKMYEYMAGGKPVISTKLQGIIEEFGNDTGVVYVDNPEGVLKKAIELSENGNIRKLGLKARNYVEKYRWDNIVDEFEAILEGLL